MINLPNVKGLVTIGKGLIMAHRPELLFGASITATLGAVGLAAKGGYDAGVMVERQENTTGTILTPQQKANLTWHCYIPAAITTVTALGSTTGLHIVHVKEKKALAQAALAAMEEIKSELKVYENELIGVVDPEKAQEVKNKVHENRADENGISRVMNSDGEVEELFLVRDPMSGRDIWSNKARIEEAVVELGNMMNGSGDVSLNNFYDQAGFVRLDSAEEIGWSGALPAISWNDVNGLPISGVRDDGRPFRGFRFLSQPEKDFDSNH